MSLPLKNTPTASLLDGPALRQKLEIALPQAKKHIAIISAYITEEPILFLRKFAPERIPIHLVCRLSPTDVASGSTSIKALKLALQQNIRASSLHNLHAKLYSIDYDTIFVGSANFTNNGLIIHGTGNLEACSQISSNQESINFINKILKYSTPLTISMLDKMEDYIQSHESKTIPNSWPENIIKDNEGIWVHDFFLEKPGKPNAHDADLLGIINSNASPQIIKENLLQTRAIQWLISKLQTQDNHEIYFGALTQLLHDDLKDDPTPYRKTIKELLANLLSYIDTYLNNVIEVSAPSHSQIVKLLIQSE